MSDMTPEEMADALEYATDIATWEQRKSIGSITTFSPEETLVCRALLVLAKEVEVCRHVATDLHRETARAERLAAALRYLIKVREIRCLVPGGPQYCDTDPDQPCAYHRALGALEARDE